jgi:hypothetical protein
MNSRLVQALERVARRGRQVRLWASLTVLWMAWLLLCLGIRAWSPTLTTTALATLLGGVALSGLIAAILAGRGSRDRRQVARTIEARFPELGTGLLAALEQDEASGGRPVGYLKSSVITGALDHARAHDWTLAIPPRRLRGWKVAHACAAVMLGVILVGLVDRSTPLFGHGPTSQLAGEPADVRVEPGTTEIERGTPLLVVARFGSGVPLEAALAVEDAASKVETRVAMKRSLDDPTFAARVDSVEADLTYRVDYAGRSTEPYRVTVFEYPEVRRVDARLAFPSYTGLETKVVEDVRHVTAVEGTELTLSFRLNKEVAEASLVDEAGQVVPLTPLKPGDDPLIYTSSFVLAESHRYKVKLRDPQGRPDKRTTEVAIRVTKNKPASVAATRPAHDVRVSPVEELTIADKAEDDFGVVRHGVSFALAGEEPREVVLGSTTPAPKHATGEHLIPFETLQAKPDQLLTYFFWAEDIGPDGKPRRTSGDMFFAEVRHFEEIFRQGEQPPSGDQEQQQQQGAGQQAEQLAELQKQVINGTWTLVRRETRATPSPTYAADVKAVLDGQKSALEKLEAMGSQIQDAASKASHEQASRSMKDAIAQLEAAASGPAIAPLAPALSAEQAAYQALLRLRAREFEVTRRNSRQRQSGGGGGNSASERQLNQLELKNDENRYEQQSSARAGQSQREREQAENKQVLDRLKELARRQGDLNDRVKELQSALEAARDAEAREEIARQLKRLRDQQEQVLRDADELRERMEREENRDRMAQARDQIEQSREHARQAAEALEKGQLSQAVTEGARARQQLEDLREGIRKNSSDRFNEDLTAMRDQARQLDERQNKLSEQLDAWEQAARPSLRDDGRRQEVKQGLANQQTELDGLLNRMKETVQQAEETEPLLARELFDTVKKADTGAIPNALKEAEQLAEIGVANEAARASRTASEGLGQLREGVERAARGILGDETAALKRAQGELNDLTNQVDRELARATPPGEQPGTKPGEIARGQATPKGQPRPGQTGQPAQRGARQPGQPGEPGEPRQGEEGQPGQQGQGQRQPGQQGQGEQGQGQQGQGQRQPGQQGQGEQGQGQQGQGQQAQGQQGQEQQGQGQQGQGQGQQGQGQQGQGQGQQGQGQQGQGQGQQGQGQQGQGQQGQGQQGQGQQGQGRPGGQPGGGGGAGGLDDVLRGLSGGPGGPITGEGFRQWSDRMRDVEDLLTDPNLRAEAARIRDRVRGAREDYKRHSREPDPKSLQELVANPIRELRDRVAEEIRRRETPDALVPIDRDPVPPKYADGVRKYYERLGSGR